MNIFRYSQNPRIQSQNITHFMFVHWLYDLSLASWLVVYDVLRTQIVLIIYDIIILWWIYRLKVEFFTVDKYVRSKAK